jgi:hypothetical protein
MKASEVDGDLVSLLDEPADAGDGQRGEPVVDRVAQEQRVELLGDQRGDAQLPHQRGHRAAGADPEVPAIAVIPMSSLLVSRSAH